MMRRLLILSALLVLPDAAYGQTTCEATSSAPTYPANSQAPLSCDLSGNLRTAAGASGTPTTVTQTPATSGGTSLSSNLVANNHTSVAIKASPGQVFAVEAFNNGATIAYLKLYNAVQGSTTCGSGTPVARYMIPAATAGGAGFVTANVNGDAYSTAITSCVVTGFADNDATDPAATTYMFTVHYK